MLGKKAQRMGGGGCTEAGRYFFSLLLMNSIIDEKEFLESPKRQLGQESCS